MAVRSAWDYDTRLPAFLDWATSVGSTLLHGAAVFAWNADKAYLLDLERAAVPVVPSAVVERPRDLVDAAEKYAGAAMVKPRTGADGRGVVRVRDPDDLAHVSDGPWLVQPLVESVRSEGEQSVFVFGGRATSQLRKVAGDHDIRVHEHHGGASHPTRLDPEAGALAVRALAAAADVTGTRLRYGRVDILRYQGRLVVSEVELTEPSLYLDDIPENGEAFAEVLQANL
ncbi:ATP-grasp domain-containing protein [Nocardioides sp. MAHUQ-72]|uniref:ATP-grasp domain-containing protein n=1 Tax=unclassified Nocardioides TaxID=2615069 RepID=UPI00361B89A1